MAARNGFTLVELLVAIAIFAVLSMLGWKVFDYLLKVKDRNAEHETYLFELQDAYQQILRDSLQIIPLTANDGRQLQAALLLNDRSFIFSKAGVSDPLKQGVSPYERIEYRYDSAQKKVYRLKYANLNIPNRVQPISSTLLERVDQFKITVLNPQELTQWPENISDPNNVTELKKLPLGFKVQLTVAGTDYEWVLISCRHQAKIIRCCHHENLFISTWYRITHYFSDGGLSDHSGCNHCQTTDQYL
jgi:general secretion pathway protein J